MKRNIFIYKKNNKFYFFILFILLLTILIYFISFYLIKNQEYFIISYKSPIKYYIIPNDKEGEKVKFIDKKSINNLSIFQKNNSNNISELNYTIQLFSDTNYKNIDKYINNVLNSKSEIIITDQLFIFTINSQIGTDYFLTYQNFNTKNEAMRYCKKLSFVKKCLILKPIN